MKKNYWVFKKNQWFFEDLEDKPWILKTLISGVKIKKKIFSGKSPYQRIEVIDTSPFGRILVLDGVIQLSQEDEFIFHEMFTHLAMFYHSNPQKVLIIGGGDGGILREVLKHPVKEVYLVEIDKKVIEVSQKYLPFVSKGAFKDKRAKIFVEDGLKFVRKYKDFFDVVVLDLTEPMGPSLNLFSKNFYQDIFKTLTKNGVLSVHSGCIFDQFLYFRNILKKLKKVFPFTKIHKASIPSLQCANGYSFIIAAKFNLDYNSPTARKRIEKKYKKLNLDSKYYSPQIHFSSAILPKYLKEKLK